MIAINGHAWSIYRVSRFDCNLRRPDGTIALGSTDTQSRSIYIQEGLPEYVTEKVLNHELTHAYMHELGIRIEPMAEELTADFLATYSGDILKISKNIIKYWYANGMQK